MTESQTLGFIGTGVMGEPMCRNLAAKSGARVLAWDPAPAPLERLRGAGVDIAQSPGDVAARASTLFLCLPGVYPERAFSVEYAAKDNGYALELGRETGVRLRGAQLLADILDEACRAGCGSAYWPVIAKFVDRG